MLDLSLEIVRTGIYVKDIELKESLIKNGK